MRRSKQRLDEKRTLAVLEEGSYGVLSLADGEGQYAVPLSFAIAVEPKGDGRPGGMSVYFHSAQEGRKIEAVRAGSQASFCVVGRSDVVASKLTVAFESAIVFGRLEEVCESEEKERALLLLAAKYASEHEGRARSSIKALWDRTAVFALRVDAASGKCGSLLVES